VPEQTPRTAYKFARCAAVAALLATGVVATGEQKMIDQQVLNESERLAGYLAANAKYNVVPPPAIENRAEAVRFVREHLTSTQSLGNLRKLSRLAVFYQLSETSGGFENLLTEKEADATGVPKAAVLLVTLAWIGNETQVANAAQEYLRQLENRADIESQRQLILEVCQALGSPAAIAQHRQWVTTHMQAAQRQLADAEREHRDRQVSGLRNEVDELEEYLGGDVARTESEIALRQRILQLSPTEQISRLARLYLETEDYATPALAYWAGITLLRMSSRAPDLRAHIARTFVERAREHEKPVDPGDEEHELVRAKALRAAQLFGASFDTQQLNWLHTQRDTGSDLLAWRPQWQYLEDRGQRFKKKAEDRGKQFKKKP